MPDHKSLSGQRKPELPAKRPVSLPSVFENSPDAVVIFDDQGVIQDCNPCAEELFGVTRAKWYGLKATDIVTFSSEEWARYRDILAQRREGVVVPATELTVTTLDGRRLDLETSSYPIDDDGKRYTITIIRDVAQRKQIQIDLKENQTRLNEAQEMGKIGDWSYQVATGAVKCSEELYRLLEVQGNHEISNLDDITQYYGDAGAKLILAAAQQATITGGQCEQEVTAQLPSGRQASHHVVIRAARQVGGHVTQLHGTVQDVSDRNQIEEELRREKAMLESVTTNAGAGIAVISRDYRTRWANGLLKGLYGEVEGKPCFMAYNGRHSICPQCGVREIFENGASRIVHEQKGIDTNGEEIWAEIVATPIYGKDGTIEGAVEMVMPITEKKKAEAALRESETKFRTIFEQSTDGLFLLTDTFVDCNEMACQQCGCSREEILGRTPLDFAPDFQPNGELSRLMASEYICEAVAGNPQHFYWKMKKVDGQLFDTEIALSAIRLHGRSLLYGQVRDISRRKKAEESERRLAAAVSQTAEGVVITNLNGNIEYVNPAFERMTQYRTDEVLGQNPRILRSGQHDAAFYEAMWKTLKSGLTWQGRVTNKRKDGSLYTENMTVSPILDNTGTCTHFVAVKRDVSHEIELGQMLAQSQKMEAVGRLAGGIAHDFNNLLTVILGYSEVLVRRLPDDSKHHGDAMEISAAAGRAASLTRQLLAFSRKEMTQPQHVSLDAIVAEMSKMLKRLIGENIDMALQSSKDPTIVYADPGQLEQIVMNLVVNARDAMPKGGSLRVETGLFHLESSRSLGRFNLEPGAYVTLSVKDTGVGMSDEILSHLFEPFFTTKELGKGTGLGLATVYGIVTEQKGAIEVLSQLSVGTEFVVYLPLSPAAASDSSSKLTQGEDLAQGETIILVEDDSVVRSIVSKMLVELGYRVITCAEPLEALQHGCGAKVQFDLLLTDVIMPKMNGPELAERFVAWRPKTKVLFMSGYPDQAITPESLSKLNAGFIHKPFTRVALALKLREVLDCAAKTGAVE
ncbi:MAG: PAS domain S-box protein [Candidatus Zixiibacteriota bacterium]